jgi:hypothetical protein
MKGKRVVLLAGGHESTHVVYWALQRDLPIDRVIIEGPVSRVRFWQRRVKMLGVWRVGGQLLFQMLVVPALAITSRRRVAALRVRYGLDATPIEPGKIIRVPSANSPGARAALAALDPDVVVIHGTRILSAKTIGCVRATFINLHAGITPQYRGVHGAYWALVEGNRVACGVTVHVVDAGIDTGAILSQATIAPTADDSFVTYPIMQLATGLPLLKDAVERALDGRVEVLPPPTGKSRLWSHPTVLEYLWHRARRGVR